MNRICLVGFVLLFFFSALYGCSSEPDETVQEQQDETSLKTIVAVGDSLTAGYGVDESESYPSQLEKKLQAEGYNYRVINSGVSAETSSGTLARMNWILTLKPDIVILETGANDGLRGTSVELLESNIRKILESLENNKVTVLFAGMKMVYNLGPMYVKKFNSIYPRLAEDFDVVYYPFFLEGVAMKSSLNLSDGVHPNPGGYATIVDNIYPYVVDTIKKHEKQ